MIPNLITPAYLELMKEAHKRYDFGVSSGQYASAVLQLCKKHDTSSVLDYGCGQAHLAAALPHPIACYDPAIAEYAAPPDPADIVVCTDVLEHVEPSCIHDVFHHLRQLTRVAGFFAIATRKASKVLADGRNAHLLVEKANWWERLLIDAGFKITTVTSGRKGEAIFYVQ